MSKILVVDDQPELLEMIRSGLQLSGYHVCTATDGAAALQMAAQFLPDLIILDFNLPGPSGSHLCQGLHKIDTSLPILLISGTATITEVHASMQAGACEYLRKPFELSQLLERVHVLLS